MASFPKDIKTRSTHALQNASPTCPSSNTAKKFRKNTSPSIYKLGVLIPTCTGPRVSMVGKTQSSLLGSRPKALMWNVCGDGVTAIDGSIRCDSGTEG